LLRRAALTAAAPFGGHPARRKGEPLKSNYLRAVLFERPDYIPMAFHINDAC